MKSSTCKVWASVQRAGASRASLAVEATYDCTFGSSIVFTCAINGEFIALLALIEGAEIGIYFTKISGDQLTGLPRPSIRITSANILILLFITMPLEDWHDTHLHSPRSQLPHNIRASSKAITWHGTLRAGKNSRNRRTIRNDEDGDSTLHHHRIERGSEIAYVRDSGSRRQEAKGYVG